LRTIAVITAMLVCAVPGQLLGLDLGTIARTQGATVANDSSPVPAMGMPDPLELHAAVSGDLETEGQAAAGVHRAAASEPAIAGSKRFAAATPETEEPTITISPEDTLSTLAQQLRPDETLTLQQTMLAIQRLNPNAFIDGNINRLRGDLPLRVPSREQIEAVDALEANEVVVRQYQEFAGLQLPAAPEANQNAVAASEDASRVADSGEIGTTAQGGSSILERRVTELENQLSLQQQESDSLRREREQLQTTVSNLNAQIDAAETIVNRQDQQLAELQNSLDQVAMEIAQQAVEPRQSPGSVTEGRGDVPQIRNPGPMNGILPILTNNIMMIGIALTLAVLLFGALLFRRGRTQHLSAVSVPDASWLEMERSSTASRATDGAEHRAGGFSVASRLKAGSMRKHPQPETDPGTASANRNASKQPDDVPRGTETPIDDGVEALDDSALLSGEDEAATNLELAYAYQRMGNAEGARELLEEVIDAGSIEQASEARKLLATLD